LQCLNSKEKLGARKVVNAVGPDGLPLYPLLKKDNGYTAVDSGLRKITKLEAKKWDLRSVLTPNYTNKPHSRCELLFSPPHNISEAVVSKK
jgi:hypothetical protein